MRHKVHNEFLWNRMWKDLWFIKIILILPHFFFDILLLNSFLFLIWSRSVDEFRQLFLNLRWHRWEFQNISRVSSFIKFRYNTGLFNLNVHFWTLIFLLWILCNISWAIFSFFRHCSMPTVFNRSDVALIIALIRLMVLRHSCLHPLLLLCA